MRKKLLVMGVVVIALLGFSGIASSGVYMQYWETMNSKRWIHFGELVPGYDVYGRYNYRDHMVWKEFDGVIYVPTHWNWHINYDLKCLDGNKPITMTHYNFMYNLDFTPTKFKSLYMGYLHVIDPKASDRNWPGESWQGWFWWGGLTPAITKYKNPLQPTIEDTTKLIDWVFENLDFSLIPLIDRIDFYDIEGNILTIDVSLLNQR
jgi:hypothetical protein